MVDSQLTPEARRAIRQYVAAWASSILAVLGLGNVAAWYTKWPDVVEAAKKRAEGAGADAAKETVRLKANEILQALEKDKYHLEGQADTIRSQTDSVAEDLRELDEQRRKLKEGISVALDELKGVRTQITELLTQTTELTGDEARRRLGQLEALAKAMTTQEDLEKLVSLGGTISVVQRKSEEIGKTCTGLIERAAKLEQQMAEYDRLRLALGRELEAVRRAGESTASNGEKLAQALESLEQACVTFDTPIALKTRSDQFMTVPDGVGAPRVGKHNGPDEAFTVTRPNP